MGLAERFQRERGEKDRTRNQQEARLRADFVPGAAQLQQSQAQNQFGEWGGVTGHPE